MNANYQETGLRIIDMLKNQAKTDGIGVEQLAKNFVLARLAARLSKNEDAASFMTELGFLKGGQMWNWDCMMQDRTRPTSDIDLQILNETVHNEVKAAIQSSADMQLADGLYFVVGNISDLEHPHSGVKGLRFPIVAYFGRLPAHEKDRGAMSVSVHIDISFGGYKPSGMEKIRIPTVINDKKGVLNLETGYINKQPWRYQIAEKLHTIVYQEMNNTRLKDYRDLYQLALAVENGKDFGDIAKAVDTVFADRHTDIPLDKPVGLTYDYHDKYQELWSKRRVREGWGSTAPESLMDVINKIDQVFGDLVVQEYALKLTA